MMDEVKAVLWGRYLSDKLIKENPGKNMVFTLETIGDQCVELAYAKAYKQYNSIQHLAIITTNPKHPVLKYFSDSYDSLISVTKKELNILLKFFKSDLGQIYRRNHKEILCAFYTSYVRSDLLFDNPYICLADIEKQIYRIPQETMPCAIKTINHDEWIADLEGKNLIVPGKTILLNPFANSCKGVPSSFFEKLANECINSGYKVITGIHGDQKPVFGTNGIDFPLDKAIALSNACGFVVGLRSGFLDLCTFADAKIVAIDHESYSLSDATKLEDWWPQNDKIRTFRYHDDEQTVITEILSYLVR